MLSAVYKGRWVDKVSMIVAVLGISIPGFWLGLMIMLLFRGAPGVVPGVRVPRRGDTW